VKALLWNPASMMAGPGPFPTQNKFLIIGVIKFFIDPRLFSMNQCNLIVARGRWHFKLEPPKKSIYFSLFTVVPSRRPSKLIVVASNARKPGSNAIIPIICFDILSDADNPAPALAQIARNMRIIAVR